MAETFPASGCVQREKFFLTEKQEILHFYQYPVTNEGIFGKIIVEVLHLMAIAAVEG